MKTIVKHVLAATAITSSCLLASVSAFAGSAEHAPVPKGSQSKGFYTDVNLGLATFSGNRGTIKVPGWNAEGLGGNVNLGYKFGPHFAVEIGYSALQTAANFEDVSHFADAALKFILPLRNPNFDVFLKLGGAAVHYASLGGSYYQGAVYGGVGASYWVRSNLGIVLQWAGTSEVNGFTSNIFTGGFSYLF